MPRPSPSSGLEDKKRVAKERQNAKGKAISINKDIIALAKAGKWKEMLTLYQEQKEDFNTVNYSTMMSKFWRIRQMRTNDPSFHRFLDELSATLNERGIAWLGTSSRELSTIVHAIAKMKLSLKGNSSAMNIFKFMEDAKTVQWLFDCNNAQHVSNCVWACGTLGLKSPNLFRLLDQRGELLFDNGAPQNVAICIWACGTLGIESPHLFQLLDQRGEWLFENGVSQDVANCVAACAKLGIKLPNLFQLIDQRSEWLFENGDTQNISNCVWACGKVKMESPNLFRLLDQRSAWLFDSGNSQEVAMCVWACGTLGVKSPNLFRLLDQRSEWLIQNKNTQDMSNSVWACATLGIQSPNLFRLLEERSEWLVSTGDPQCVTNCLWACGTLGVKSPNLFRALDRRSEWLFTNGSAQNISNAIWACATLGVKSPELFRMLENRSEWLFQNAEPRVIGICVWACATLGIESPNLFRLLDERSAWLFENGFPQEISNCVHACGSLGVEAPNLLRSLDDHAEWFVDNGNEQNISLCASGLAVLGARSPAFFSALEARIDRFLAIEPSFQSLCRVLYAMVVLDVSFSTQSVMLVKVWKRLLEEAADCSVTADFRQLRYTQAFASVYGVELATPSSDVQRKLDLCDQNSLTITSSSYERAVSKALLNMGFPHQCEYSPVKSVPRMLPIDIACPDRMIAIECDGPSHYISSVHDAKKNRENGPTKAKRRMLQHLGWQVINLNWMDAHAHNESEAWVREKMSEAGVELRRG